MAFTKKRTLSLKQLLVVFFAVIFSVSNSFAQVKYERKHLSFKVKRIVHKLEKYDVVTGRRIGKSAIKSEQYRLFEKLESKATESELYELTNHSSPVVRAYAFYGLANEKSVKMLAVIEKNQNDTVAIIQQFGCIKAGNTVIGFMAASVNGYVERHEIELTAAQKTLLEEIHNAWWKWREDMLNRDTAKDE